MTTKDYRLIAQTLRAAHPGTKAKAFTAIVRALSDALARDNARFDAQKFLKACHP